MSEEKARWEFAQEGLTYHLWADELQTHIYVNRLKRQSQELHGQLRVEVNFKGVKTVDGVLHSARYNLSSGTARSTLAKLLASRTAAFDSRIDWFDGLETLCLNIDRIESQGEPISLLNGADTEMGPVKFALDPTVPELVTSLMYGPGGAGKSIVALAGALSIASNVEIVPGLTPVIQGPVLYLDWETDGYVVSHRLHAISRGAAITPGKFHYRHCNRPLADDADEISREVSLNGIVYVVIDSCSPAMGMSSEYGDANESTLRLFQAIRHIGVTTQIVDHVSKQEMRNEKGKVMGLLPYGSIAKVNLARAAWELRNVTEPEDDHLQIALLNTKANDTRIHPPIHVSIDWRSDTITFEETTDIPEARTRVEAVTRILLDEPNGLTEGEIRARMGTKKRVGDLATRLPGIFMREGGKIKLVPEWVSRQKAQDW